MATCARKPPPPRWPRWHCEAGVTTQNNTIRATLSQCRHAQPLVILDLLGQGAELRPAELRAIAAALLRMADDAQARRLTHRGKPLPADRREYPLAP